MTTYFLVNLRGRLTGTHVRNLMEVQKSESAANISEMCFYCLCFIRKFKQRGNHPKAEQNLRFRAEEAARQCWTCGED